MVLAASEGARFDGWVEVEPDHVLHLYQHQPWNAPRPRLWIDVPVADISPEIAQWADGAVVDPRDGPLAELVRAPLNRRGFTFAANGSASRLYDVDLGGPNTGDVWGGGSRIAFGGFPVHWVGLLAVLDIQGASSRLNTRFGLELQGYLPPFRRMGLGFYGGGGVIRARRDELDTAYIESGGYYEGGGILQIDITTRLAFEMRGGVWLRDDEVMPTFGLGFAVY